MPAGSSAVTLPFGPSTSTELPLTVYFTPFGIGIGFLPIRDMFEILCGLRVPQPKLSSTAAWALWPIVLFQLGAGEPRRALPLTYQRMREARPLDAASVR